ncbi:MAG: PspC domain-containing protein [Thermoleophilia bacterium]|nr:PspC domain-containing protein [Thermoleophilia bacterium]
MPADSTSLPPAPGVAATHPPLRRSRDDRIVVGVCAGIARTLGAPVLIVRLVALAVAIAVPPLALIAYAGLAIAMPRDDGRAVLGGSPDDRRETIVGWTLVGLALISLATGIGSSMLGGPGGVVLLAAGIVLLVVHHQRHTPSQPTAPATPVAAAPAATATTARRPAVDLPYPGVAAVAADEPTRTMPFAAPAATQAPPPSSGRREPSVGLYGLAAVVGASMVALVLSAIGGFDASATGVAVTLGIGALAMTTAAIVLARRRGAFVLIALAGLLAIGAAGTAAVGDRIDQGVGDRIQTVASPADAAVEHRLGIGQLTIDVSQSALVSEVTTIRARLGIGELVVRVPEGVRVLTVGPVTPEGLRGVNDAAGAAAERTIRLDADVDIGDARVELTNP